MKNITKPAIILTVTILFVLSIVGCEEQQQLPTSKKARLIANQNMNLKEEQLKDRDTQIRSLQAQLQTQKDLLGNCQKENNSLMAKKQKEGEELMKMLLISGDTEKQNLKKQVETLKQEIRQLEAKAAN